LERETEEKRERRWKVEGRRHNVKKNFTAMLLIIWKNMLLVFYQHVTKENRIVK
jgi:hypothetical protein